MGQQQLLQGCGSQGQKGRLQKEGKIPGREEEIVTKNFAEGKRKEMQCEIAVLKNLLVHHGPGSQNNVVWKKPKQRLKEMPSRKKF